jgi:hypothetical protein
MIETTQDDGQLLQSVYALISHAVRDPERRELNQPTHTSAWTVRELLFHLLLDAQRALVAFSSPADGPADVDNVTYWRPFRPANGDGGRAHAEYVTRAAAAYSSAELLVEQWTETSTAAAWAGAGTDRDCLDPRAPPALGRLHRHLDRRGDHSLP